LILGSEKEGRKEKKEGRTTRRGKKEKERERERTITTTS
jgi:hypothetical protein